MKLKNNKGYTGIDISIAMIIILIFIPTIFSVVYNIQGTRASVERKAKAVSVATDVLEIAKSLEYEKVVLTEPETGDNFITKLDQRYTSSTYTGAEEANYEYVYYSTTGENNEHYQIQIGLLNYHPNDTDTLDLVKRVRVKVLYPLGNETRTIDISTVLQNS